MKKVIAVSIIGSLLAGCNVTTDHLGADVYDTTELNTKQQTKTVNIISILPAKVAVDNSEAKNRAQTAGALLGSAIGAVGGAIAGDKYKGKSHSGAVTGAVAGGVAGGTVGALAGGAVKDKLIVEGVRLTYKEGNDIYTSTQAGRACQFQPGTAVTITTKANETRIQPNAACPDKK